MRGLNAPGFLALPDQGPRPSPRGSPGLRQPASSPSVPRPAFAPWAPRSREPGAGPVIFRIISPPLSFDQ